MVMLAVLAAGWGTPKKEPVRQREGLFEALPAETSIDFTGCVGSWRPPCSRPCVVRQIYGHRAVTV